MEEQPIPSRADQYWRRFAEAFIAPLRANGDLDGFITNPAVTGAYAEVWVRDLISSMVPALRVSTGAVIRTSDETRGRDLRSLPQSDVIIWDPSELPALFEMGEFALVHTSAARAILEIKRTSQRNKAFVAQLQRQRKRLLSGYKRNVLGVVLSAARPPAKLKVHPGWVEDLPMEGPPPIVRLLNGAKQKADADGVFGLIHFLTHVARQSASAPRAK